ncbi:MAG: hypothetical protein GXO32_06070 [Crenarchaeota archaeon]|nr:hypothetical protein [Thermoproteota archaeon]
MCRLLALHCIECRELSNAISLTLDALVEASSFDSRLIAVTAGRRESHGDGWGYALALNRGGAPAVAHDKFILPIFSQFSREVLAQVARFLGVRGEAAAILHARAASPSEPLGSRASHPYEYRIRVGDEEEATLYFAHNGGANKDALRKELKLARHYHTDSYALGLYIARALESSQCLEERCLARAVAEAVGRFCVKDGKPLGGVTAALLVSDKGFALVASSWFDSSDELRAQYYQPYAALIKRGERALAVFASPTVIDRLRELGLAWRAKPIDAGEVIAIDARADSGFRRLARIG